MSDAKGWLSLKDVSVLYNGRTALKDLSLDISRGESVAVIGSNGAGKTSLLNAIAGLARKDQAIGGRTRLDGEDLPWGNVRVRRRAGIGLVPEKDKVFRLLTVDENLSIGERSGGRGRKQDDALDWFPALANRRGTLAGNLSGGEQQMLALAITLLASPKLLLLDEPSLGLATPVVEDLCQSLDDLRREFGLTILIAESDTQWLPRLADRAIAIDRGKPIATFDHINSSSLDEIHGVLLGMSAPLLRGHR